MEKIPKKQFGFRAIFSTKFIKIRQLIKFTGIFRKRRKKRGKKSSFFWYMYYCRLVSNFSISPFDKVSFTARASDIRRTISMCSERILYAI